jgi:hypothetical protein
MMVVSAAQVRTLQQQQRYGSYDTPEKQAKN